MAVRANAFVLQKNSDVPLGSFFLFEQHWFFRAQVDDGGDILEVGIKLTADAKCIQLHRPTSTLTLAPDLTFEVRVIGPVQGPGKPPHASLAWAGGGGQAITTHDYFLTIDGGLEALDVSRQSAFFATHWGVWVIDKDGKTVSPDPLFVIGAEA